MGTITDEAKAIARADAEQPSRVQHSGFVELREPGSGKLLMRLEPQRALIQIRRRGVETLIDLTQYGLTYCGHSDGGFV